MFEIQRHGLREIDRRIGRVDLVVGDKQILLIVRGRVGHGKGRGIGGREHLLLEPLRVVAAELVLAADKPVMVRPLVIPAAVGIAARLVGIDQARSLEKVFHGLLHTVGIPIRIVRPNTDRLAFPAVSDRRAGLFDRNIAHIGLRADERTAGDAVFLHIDTPHDGHGPGFGNPGYLRRVLFAATPCRKQHQQRRIFHHSYHETFCDSLFCAGFSGSTSTPSCPTASVKV